MFKLNFSLLALTALIPLASCSTIPAARSTASVESNLTVAEPKSEMEQAKASEMAKDFDGAIVHYEYALKDVSWAKSHPTEWLTGLRSVLSLAVEEKHNRNLALELMSEIAASKAVPEAMSAQLQSMKQVLRQDLKEEHAHEEFSSRAGNAINGG